MGADILNAVDSVSEMSLKKQELELHTQIASCLVQQVKGRHLDYLHQSEERIMQGKHSDVNELINCRPQDDVDLEDWDADKLRIQIIAFLHRQLHTLPEEPLQNYLEALRGQAETKSAFSVFTGKIKEKVMGREQMLPLTKMLHSVLSHKESQLTYLDTLARHSAVHPREYTNILVFVVGGGSYTEYHNLLHYAQEKGKHIVYGTTDMPSPKEFLAQLRTLASY